jgi:hypothetical protein
MKTISKFLLERNMKNKKWLTYTVGILLTLVVLAAVAGAGIRFGMMQNASFARPAFAHNFDGAPQARQGLPQNNDGNQSTQGNPQAMQRNFRDNGGPQAMQGQGFDNRGGDRRGGMPFFPPIFGLIHLVVLGLLIWLGYKLVKNSGWRLTRVAASPAPVANETSSMEVEEKKESE